jgi:hypothetical protein
MSRRLEIHYIILTEFVRMIHMPKRAVDPPVDPVHRSQT